MKHEYDKADKAENRLSDAARPERTRYRWAWWLLAYASLGLGLLGVALPGLPTVPFVLLAAYAAARGSKRLHAWLVTHPRFGEHIRDWERDKAVSRRAKTLATAMMTASAVVMFFTAPKAWMAALGTGIMVVVAVWLWRRPEPGQGSRAAPRR